MKGTARHWVSEQHLYSALRVFPAMNSTPLPDTMSASKPVQDANIKFLLPLSVS